MPMMNDLDLIVKQYPAEWDALHVYAIGDVHVGSEQYNDDATRKMIDIIRNDPVGVVCLCGDTSDLGLRNSKTNVYHAKMQPREQLDFVFHLFEPIAEKIAAVVPGNHEERVTREVGTCPLYDLCVRWGIPEVYRENVAITKFMFGNMPGQAKDRQRQNSFVGITTHGSTRNKHKRFIAGFDGIDFAISGHTHMPEYSPHGKIRVDVKSATAKHVPYKEIVVDAHMKPGGYSLKKEYEIAPPPELQYIELYVYREGNGRDRKNYKVMNYHAIQI